MVYHGVLWGFLLLFLFVCSVTDARQQLIRNPIVLAGIVSAAVVRFLFEGVHGLEHALIGTVIGFGIGVFGNLLGLIKVKLWAMGDAKMIALTGSFIGCPGLLFVLFLGMTCFVFEGFGRMLLKREYKKFAFAPSYTVGAVLVLLSSLKWTIPLH